MKDSQGNILEVGDKAYFANHWTIQTVTITELRDGASSCTIALPNGRLVGAHPEGLVLKEKFEWPNKYHESHKSLRSSDASTFDFICEDCGATDDARGGWAALRKPCKGDRN